HPSPADALPLRDALPIYRARVQRDTHQPGIESRSADRAASASTDSSARFSASRARTASDSARRALIGFTKGGDTESLFVPIAAKDRKSTRLNSSHVKISY